MTSRLLRWRWTRAGGRGYLTATQAAAALRPFYFAVHPDLFGLHPEMYKTNEQSLKALHGYMDGLYAGPSPVQHSPVTLKFYVRQRKTPRKDDDDQATVKSVRVSLREKDPCAAVRTILQCCDLPTGHLPPRREEDKRAVDRRVDDEELIQFWASPKKKKSAAEPVSLPSWLKRMSAEARRMQAEHEAVELDVKRKVEDIKDETGLIDIDFNLSWSLAHCRGCLQLFRKAMTNSPAPLVNLNGWILKFVRHGTYVSLDRSILLGVDDLPDQWMSLVSNLNPPQAYYGDLPRLERRLSELLAGARLTGPWDTPVREYRNRLIAMADRLAADQHWRRVNRERWSDLRVVIENEACGLMLMDNGTMTVPYTAPPEALLEFVRENHRPAVDLMDSYGRMREELKTLRRSCMQKWNLEAVEWDETGNVSQQAVKECLQRIMVMSDDHGQTEELKALLRGHRLHIGPQEACVVLPDGRLSIPCDWRL